MGNGIIVVKDGKRGLYDLYEIKRKQTEIKQEVDVPATECLLLGRAGCSKVTPYTLRRYALLVSVSPYSLVWFAPVLVRWCHCVLDCQSSGKGVYLPITNRQLGIWHTGVLLWVGL